MLTPPAPSTALESGGLLHPQRSGARREAAGGGAEAAMGDWRKRSVSATPSDGAHHAHHAYSLVKVIWHGEVLRPARDAVAWREVVLRDRAGILARGVCHDIQLHGRRRRARQDERTAH